MNYKEKFEKFIMSRIKKQTILRIIFMTLAFFCILAIMGMFVHATSECAVNVDYQLIIEQQAKCNMDMDCTIFGSMYKCVTPESRSNDEIQSILEESSSLNINFINAWKAGYNGVCAKIKKVTTLPDCSKQEGWYNSWIGTLSGANQIPVQYLNQEETLTVSTTKCEPTIINNTVTKYVNVTTEVPVYKNKYVLPPTKSVIGYLTGFIGIVICFLVYGFHVGFKTRFEACPKCGSYNIKKILFLNNYYCSECFRKIHFKRSQKKISSKEAGKDLIRMALDREKNRTPEQKLKDEYWENRRKT